MDARPPAIPNHIIRPVSRWAYKKGQNSGKKCRKIVIIEFDLDIHKIHIHTTPSFNPTFRSQVIIQKSIQDGHTDHTHCTSPLFDKVSGNKDQRLSKAYIAYLIYKGNEKNNLKLLCQSVFPQCSIYCKSSHVD